jgi:hypothetical protein
LSLTTERDRNMVRAAGDKPRHAGETQTPQRASPPQCGRRRRRNVDNPLSLPEPKWCSLRGALDWVVFGKSPQSPSIEELVLGPATWSNDAEIRRAKSAILLGIDNGPRGGIDHFIWQVDNRDPYIFEQDEPAAGKVLSVSAIPGVNFETSRHEGWRELGNPQVFVRVSDLKRIFPEPLTLRADAVAADVPVSAADSPQFALVPAPASPTPVAEPKPLSDREARAAYQA